jgi:hypothetical protein
MPKISPGNSRKIPEILRRGREGFFGIYLIILKILIPEKSRMVQKTGISESGYRKIPPGSRPVPNPSFNTNVY